MAREFLKDPKGWLGSYWCLEITRILPKIWACTRCDAAADTNTNIVAYIPIDTGKHAQAEADKNTQSTQGACRQAIEPQSQKVKE